MQPPLPLDISWRLLKPLEASYDPPPRLEPWRWRLSFKVEREGKGGGGNKIWQRRKRPFLSAPGSKNSRQKARPARQCAPRGATHTADGAQRWAIEREEEEIGSNGAMAQHLFCDKSFPSQQQGRRGPFPTITSFLDIFQVSRRLWNW